MLQASLQQHAVEQVSHRDLYARYDARGGGVLLHALEAVILGHDDLVQADAPGVHGLKGQQHGHDLGQTCRGAFLVHIVAVEHAPGVQIDQDRGLSVELRHLQRQRAGGKYAGQQAQEQKKRDYSEIFHLALPLFSGMGYVILYKLYNLHACCSPVPREREDNSRNISVTYSLYRAQSKNARGFRRLPARTLRRRTRPARWRARTTPRSRAWPTDSISRMRRR